MPGTIIFKPIEANLNLGSDVLSKADPYCQFTINGQQIKSQVCKSGGKHPVWEDSVSVPATYQPTCFVELKDKDLLKDERLGSFEIDLREIESQGRLKKWYPIFHKDKPAGEILLEAVYAPTTVMTEGTAIPIQQTIQTQPVVVQSQTIPVLSHTVIPVQSQTATQTMGIPTTTYSTTMQSQGMMGAPISRTTIVGAPVTETVTHTVPLGREISGVETPFQVPTASQTVHNTIKETVIVPGMQQSIPIQPVQQVPYMSMTDTALLNPSMTESLSEYYAREALIRGVDPLGTRTYTGHSVPLNTIPLTQSVGAPGFIPQSQYLPEQQLIGQTGIRPQLPGQPALITSQNLPGPSQIPPKQL